MENNDDHKNDANRYHIGLKKDGLKNWGCSDFVSAYIPDRFKGCDGKVLSDEFLEYQITVNIEKENYEEAAIIRDELERRKSIVIP